MILVFRRLNKAISGLSDMQKRFFFFPFCFAKERKNYKKSLCLSLLNVGPIRKYCPMLILFFPLMFLQPGIWDELVQTIKNVAAVLTAKEKLTDGIQLHNLTYSFQVRLEVPEC